MGITTSTSNKSLDAKITKSATVGGGSIITDVVEDIKGIAEKAVDVVTEKNPADIEFVDVEPEIPEGGFSNTEYCDEDNINVNQLSKIMVEFQNALSLDEGRKEYYDIFAELIQGKKLGDILDEDGHIKDSSSFNARDLDKIEELIEQKGLNMSVDDYLAFYDKCVEDSKKGGASVTLTHISEDMLNNTIEEVVSTDNSYDAFVLKNSDNGNYMIVNSCTNAKSTNDLLAIAYAMSMQLTGSLDLLDYVLGYLLPSLDAEMLDSIKSTDLYMKLTSGDKSAAKKIEDIYKNELKENQDLILKYIDKAKEDGTQIELQGYSLGGGIQLAAYSSLCMNNPELEDYIASITTFNPYVSFCEENPLNISGDTDGGDRGSGPLIDYLSKSDKVRIYSNEEDYVSTFNNCLSKLIDKYCFINSQDLSDHSKVRSIADMYGVVIGGGSNHGFDVIDYKSFEDGNIISPGTFFAIDESLATTTDDDSYFFHFVSEVGDTLIGDEHKYRIDYTGIIERTLKLEHVRETVADNGSSANAFFNYMLKYIEDNVGHYNYDEFTDSMAEACWEAILAGAKDAVAIDNPASSFPEWLPDWITEGLTVAAGNVSNSAGELLSFILDKAGNKEAFKNGIKSFLNSEDNMDILMEAISFTLNGDNNRAKKSYNKLLDELAKEVENSDSELWQNVSMDIFGYSITVPSPAGAAQYSINEFLKTQFVDKLREVIDEL